MLETIMPKSYVLALGLSCLVAAAGGVGIAPAQASSYQVLYKFQGGADGFNPYANLVKVGGTLYGTTEQGGTRAFGTVFAVNAVTGAHEVLHSFRGYKDGLGPYAGLIDVGGTLYGTTTQGGSIRRDQGTVYSVKPKSGAVQIVHAFRHHEDGEQPYDNLLDVSGTVYGTTLYGGSRYNYGTVFSVDLATGAEQVLYAFQGGDDGSGPYAALIDVGGTLYGTTIYGGPGNCNDGNGVACGTVFAINAQTGAERVVYAFQGGSDGNYPSSSLIEVGDELYGTTSAGGNSSSACGSSANSCGTVFAINLKSGAERTVYAFKGGTDGFLPYAGLIEVNGTLYGTTGVGGSANCSEGCGTVYSVDPKTGIERILYEFQGGVDGELPVAALIADGSTLYGTTYYGGGTKNYGTVFAISP
jgi:uncharacterized repeat protein (TIGR03803 family)